MTPDESLRIVSVFAVPSYDGARVESDDARRDASRVVGVGREPRPRAARRHAAERRLRRWVTWTRLPTDASTTLRGSWLVAPRHVSDPTRSAASSALTSRHGPAVSSRPPASSDRRAVGSAAQPAAVAEVSTFGAVGWFDERRRRPVEPESAGPVDAPASADWMNGLGARTAHGTTAGLVGRRRGAGATTAATARCSSATRWRAGPSRRIRSHVVDVHVDRRAGLDRPERLRSVIHRDRRSRARDRRR